MRLHESFGPLQQFQTITEQFLAFSWSVIWRLVEIIEEGQNFHHTIVFAYIQFFQRGQVRSFQFQ